MSRKTRRTRTRYVHTNYRPAVQGKPATPKTPAQPSTKGYSTTRTRDVVESSSGGSNPGITIGSSSNSTQAVMIILLILFAAVSWNDLTSKVFSVAWNPKTPEKIVSLPWGKYFGMLVFIAIVVVLSSLSDEISNVVLLIVLAILAVYFIEGQGGTVSKFLDWLVSISGSKQTSSKG